MCSSIEYCVVEQEKSIDIRHAERMYELEREEKFVRHKYIHTDMYFPAQPRAPFLSITAAVVSSSCYNNRSNVAASPRASEPKREADGGLISCDFTETAGVCCAKGRSRHVWHLPANPKCRPRV
jgi:hypothetical protein